MSCIVLDAGALIALDANDRTLWAALKLAALRADPVLVPSTVVAQVWRGGARQALLARALGHCVVAGFDSVARAVGELCGRARTADICDAHVAVVAASTADVLWTSDPPDMRRLLSALPRRRSVAIVRC